MTIYFSTDYMIILLNLKSPLAATSRVRLDQCFPNSHGSRMTLKTIRSSLKVCFQTSMCSKLGPQLTVLPNVFLSLGIAWLEEGSPCLERYILSYDPVAHSFSFNFWTVAQ